jgi:hypothetical protein
VEYYIGHEVMHLALIRSISGDAGESTSLGDVYKSFLNCQNLQVEETGLGGVEVTRDGSKTTLTGKSFNCRMLRLMLEFRQEGINPFDTTWFWYGSDSATTYRHEPYLFFIVHKDKIVRDRVVIFDSLDEGFEPSIFDDNSDMKATWSTERAREKASVRLWYRKFYAETREGQLMLLRTDNPRRFYHDDWHVPDLLGIASLLRKTYLLLWVLVILAFLIFLRFVRW